MIGQLYFTSVLENDKPRTKLLGKVIALIVVDEHGTEHRVTEQQRVQVQPQPLSWKEMVDLPLKSEVLLDGKPRTVEKIFITSGDIWVKNEETGEVTEHKYFELRKV